MGAHSPAQAVLPVWPHLPVHTGPMENLLKLFPQGYRGEPGPGQLTAPWRSHCSTLRYVTAKNRWYEWAGDRWARDETRRPFDFARKIAADTKGKGRARIERAAFAAGVEKFAQADQTHAVPVDYFDQDPDVLGVPDATIYLQGRDGWSRRAPHSDDRISLQASVSPDREKGPDPDAGPLACPTWLRFLNDSTGEDADLISFLQRFMGYSLTGHTSEHTLIYVYGAGANGKSTFLETWAWIMGEYSQAASMDTFTEARGDRHSTEIAALDGPRLVTASETEAGRPWAESALKRLTGGDTMRARFMRQDSFEFQPRCKLALMGNHLPVIKDTSEAMRRRVRVVPFTRRWCAYRARPPMRRRH